MTVDEDLRVRRTRLAIRQAFEELVLEKDFTEIRVKELAERARINRKTSYLHYKSLEDLLAEIQDEIVDSFLSVDASYSNMDDIRKLTRLFFKNASVTSPVYEKLLCSGSWEVVWRGSTAGS